MSDSSKAVFLSYASQDADAARRIAQALRAEGVEVWFDESALGGGEAWDASIRRQIRDCALFVAIVSASTQARKEGYFRLEWKLADERSQLIAEGTPFVLPVIIDGTKERDALVPKSFLGVQWTWLPHGEVPPGFVARVQKLLYPAAASLTATKPELGVGLSTPTAPTITPPPAQRETRESSVASVSRKPRTALVFAAGALSMLIAGVLFVAVRDGGFGMLTGGGSRPAAGAGVTKFTIPLPPGQVILSPPAMSRDGRVLAFTAGTLTEEPRLYVRRLEELESQVAPGSSGAAAPFFSPDGRSIAYFANGRLVRWTIGGGAPVPLVDTPFPMGGTWGGDNTIIFVPTWNGGLFRLSSSGGTPEVLLRPDGKQDYAFVFPRIVPNQPEVLFTAWGKETGVWRLNLATKKRTKQVPNGNSGEVTTSGHLLMGVKDPSPESFGLLAGLLAAPYREDAQSSHEPTLVVPGIHYVPSQPNLWSNVSATGTLAYVPGDVRARSLVRVDLTGRSEVFSAQPGAYTRVRVSPTTGKIVATTDYKVWLYASDGTGPERLAPENRDMDEAFALWTPDGKAVVYGSNQSGNWDIYRRIPGASKSEVLLDKELDVVPRAMAPDGTLAYEESDRATGDDIWLLEPNGKSRPWLVAAGMQMPIGFSFDGRWLAYRSDESGRFEIYVRPVAGEAARLQVSNAGAGRMAWSPKSNTLFYQEGGAMWEVDLGNGEAPLLIARRKLFEGGWALNPLGEWDYADFDVMPDGKHFLMIRREPKAIPDRINVVVNWYDELRRLVPVK